MKLWFILLASCYLTAGVSAAKTYEFTTEELAPFNYKDKKDGKLKGIAIDLLHKIMSSNGLTYKKDYVIKMMPWSRAYSQALSKPNTCAFATYVTDKRKPLFQWVGPLLTAKWSFYARKDRNIKVGSLDDAKKFKIGGYLSDAPTGYLKDRDFNVAEVNNNELNIDKLLSNPSRIDLWATGDPAGAYMARMAGKDQMIENIYTFHEIPMSISCNKEFPADLIKKMQKSLDEIEKSGEAEKVRTSY